LQPPGLVEFPGLGVEPPDDEPGFFIVKILPPHGVGEPMRSSAPVFVEVKLPAKVPVADFWALTVYDVETRALIQAPQHIAEINPNVQQLKTNADGSIDLYFGPKAPVGMESNWIQTVPGRAWFTYFRWYGPTEAYYDKTWTLPNIEKVN
jgi:hypothetical protein